MAKKKKWYAVRAGYKIGVLETWDECKLQVDGFKDAAFKAFDSHEDALLF
jgi:viroplasmin and RNaseH domain-containing protein